MGQKEMIEALSRRPDWRSRMAAAIDIVKHRSFGWRDCDCVSGLAAPLVTAMTGVDLFAQHAGQYTDADSAYRLMQDLGFDDLADLVGSFLPEHEHISRASMGDIAAIEVPTRFRHALGIVDGERIFVLSETGFGTVDLLTAARAFKVG
ncbi:hypothetical protein [Rhizobium sp. WW_1]|jgi:hypothetical protein|uniref:DUF6950 family protein n=1 Tax=Rhizobium sp. WW_1 TaxID=1907375 RepID=UPI000ADEDC06|nr:hypothetical protein [Rhizobium sp. WW_1]RKD61656.1 hypothetical protein BJ928_107258 [Rhizobium sp. WW_1]